MKSNAETYKILTIWLGSSMAKGDEVYSESQTKDESMR